MSELQATRRLERIEEKLDKVLESQIEMKKDVAEHIKRTALLEEKVEVLKTAIAVSKAIMWAGAMSAALFAFVKLWQLFAP